MSDYNLNGLDNRNFEHLTQALALEAISTGITPFGDGPDGGREATYNGKMDFPSKADPWDGYLVIQSKFRTRTALNSEDDGKWILKQLKSDLLKFEDAKRNLKKPEYYIIVTNVVLTPVEKTGTKDKVLDLLEKHKSSIGYKDYDVWDYDKLCRLLDKHRSVRASYAAYITTGDVLSKVIEVLIEQQPDFKSIMSRFLLNEMIADQFVKLEQAGHKAEHKTLLAQVFVDLPVSEHQIDESFKNDDELDRFSKGIVQEILQAGSCRLKRSAITSSDANSLNYNISHSHDPGRYVVVGGPGQGKSTIGQFICQIYRAAILQDQPKHTLSSEGLSTLNIIIEQLDKDGIALPTVRRFPFRVVLDQFATDLAKNKSKSLISYILDRINYRVDSKCSLEDLRRWLKSFPWVLILDGLDEVPISSNRKQVMEKVLDFWTEVSNIDADVLVVATTRPQGYNEEFSPKYYNHRYLVPLSRSRALHYANKLVDAQFGLDRDRKERVLSRLEMACEQGTTRRLMRSPLQVTIMATLVDTIGQPPQERWRLFQQYYEVIYQRETERDIQPSLILQKRKADVNAIHHRVGLLLQKESEHAGKTESRLPSDRFYKLVYTRIEEEGYEGEELKSRAYEITEAALQRLVFLVGLQEDRIGFEIRSLQEFMAAEALMNGRDEQVRARLETIAPISHWRNVFLFAVGKCFADRQFLRDTILQICDQLNDPENDQLCGVTLAGSRLALDILKDGVAREQPKYARQLARIAFRLLEVEEVDSCRSLGSVYEASLDNVYRSYLIQIFNQSEQRLNVGAWATVLSLVEQQIEWAVELAEKKWPNNILDQKKILWAQSFVYLGKWATQKLVAIIPFISPMQFLNMPWEIDLDSHKLKHLPNWFVSIANYVVQEQYDDAQRAEVKLNLGQGSSNLKLIYKSLKTSPVDIQNLPYKNPKWKLFVSGARFAMNPTHETLAKELRWLNNDWDASLYKSNLNQEIVWPLGACLSFSNTSDEMAMLADKAEAGLLGSTKEWLLAEDRWKNNGVLQEDIKYISEIDLPFDHAIAEKGFPLSISYLISSYTDKGYISIYDEISHMCLTTHNYRVKQTLSHFALNLISPFQIRTNNRGIDISPAKLKQLIKDASIAGTPHLRLPTLVKYPKELDKDWINFFNWLGLDEGFSLYVHDRSNRVKSLMNQLASYYIKDPSLLGILDLLGMLNISFDCSKIPNKLLLDKNFKENRHRLSALSIRLMQGGWDKAEAKKLAKLIIEISKLDDYSLYDAVYSLRKLNKNKDKEMLLLTLYDEITKIDSKDIPRTVDMLNELMITRTSLLNRKSHWAELGLPTLE